MARVTIRQRNQLTIPVDIAKALSLEEGSLCTMELINGTIVITPPGADTAPITNFSGVARGAWGDTAADVERTLAADRGSWNR
jgi:antitoxin component of MazEF toxin-antitoxin module